MASKQQRLNDANDLFKIAEQQYEDARLNLKKVKQQCEIPLIKKELEGKYFRYENASDATHKWFVYVFVKKVIAVNKVIVNKFESGYSWDDTFEHTFQIDSTAYTNELKPHKQITQEEYLEALKIFQQFFIKL